MPSTRDLLQRFRPAGAPGAATASGVPADRVAERDAELAPVFARLADPVAQAARIRQDALVEAERRRLIARDAAAARVAAARQDAEAIRAHLLAEAQLQATEAARVGSESSREAAQRIIERARATLDADVGEVMAGVRRAVLPEPERSPA
jgi:hypothetical protein